MNADEFSFFPSASISVHPRLFASEPSIGDLAAMHSRFPPRNRLAKVLPEEWRRKLVESGAPRRKYTAICRAQIVGGRVIEEMIVEEGWIIALSRDGLGGTFEQRIDFDPRQILTLDILQII